MKEFTNKYLPAILECVRRFGWIPFSLAITHIIFTLVHVYALWPPIDIPLHLLGGMAIAGFSSGIINVFVKHKLIRQPDVLVCVVLVFSLTCTATVFWEFAEWISDHTITTDCQKGKPDTMQDLFLGILGGSIFTAFYAMKLSKNGECNHES